jgi:glycosyltransferase involved in cell wall biosynthesis
MKLSVITPVFNGEKYIKETIDSVLNAIGNLDIEYLVIDDGSTDRTSEILQTYDQKIKVIRQVNQGESSAVNTGFKHAIGDYVLVVSADDPLISGAIFDNVVEFFETNPEIVVWYPNWNMIDQDGNLMRTVYVDEYSDEKLIGRFICLPGPGAFIRKSAALQIGGRRKKWKYVGDYDFWLRISRVGQLKKRDEILAQWRFHDESTSIASRGLEMYRERIDVIDEFIEQFQIHGDLSRMARSHSLYYAARLSFFSNEINGRKTIIRALLTRRGWIEDSTFGVVIYLVTAPVSSLLKPIIRILLRKLR